jgi:hypothetical protein
MTRSIRRASCGSSARTSTPKVERSDIEINVPGDKLQDLDQSEHFHVRIGPFLVTLYITNDGTGCSVEKFNDADKFVSGGSLPTASWMIIDERG